MTQRKPMWTWSEHGKVCTNSNLRSGSTWGPWSFKEARFPTFCIISLSSIKIIITNMKYMLVVWYTFCSHVYSRSHRSTETDLNIMKAGWWPKQIWRKKWVEKKNGLLKRFLEPPISCNTVHPRELIEGWSCQILIWWGFFYYLFYTYLRLLHRTVFPQYFLTYPGFLRWSYFTDYFCFFGSLQVFKKTHFLLQWELVPEQKSSDLSKWYVNQRFLSTECLAWPRWVCEHTQAKNQQRTWNCVQTLGSRGDACKRDSP